MTALASILYHGGCPDGYCAAHIIRDWLLRSGVELSLIELHPMKYGDPIPDVAIKGVYIVDFSFPPDVLREIADASTSTLLLDHHQTAAESLADFDHPNADVLIDQSASGAALAWRWTHGKRHGPPPIVERIQDRDLWRFQFSDTNDVMAAVSARPQTKEAWDEIFLTDIAELAKEGKAIQRYRERLIETAVASAREITLAGRRVLVANCSYSIASDVAGVLAEGRSFGAYYIDGSHDRSWGLRSRDGGEDVARIAELFGGGGHRNAAGFRTDFNFLGEYTS
jgi:oligoribonuclease NrnB/cAMP/cGMP phosphodiesterase (DHH superfamily)